MMNKEFVIYELPTISEYPINEADTELNIVKNNYKSIREESYKVLRFCLNSNLSKSFIYYNLFFYVEISLKYYLLVFSDDLTIGEIEDHKHNINRLIDTIRRYDTSIESLTFLFRKFVDKDGNHLNLDKYYNYKYNKLLGETSLTFDFNMNLKDIELVEEVIEWVRLHI